MHKGPVTVIATEYGTRLDNQPVSRSATVDGVPDFLNLYEYDYLNRWIARSHDPDGDGPLDFTDTHFVYDGTPPSGSLLDRAAVTIENIGQIVLHFEADGLGESQLAHRYLWGPTVDQILADEQVTDPTAPGNIVWPLTDHLNTVRDLAAYDADTDTTTIVNHLIYDAYGRITSQSDPDTTTLFAFTARPFDPATGLQNNLNPWYDAEFGRWISEDPIGLEAADANLYRYVHHVPIKWADPTGLFAEDEWKGAYQSSPPAAVKPLLDITQGTWRLFGVNLHRGPDTIELKQSGVIVLLWGHGHAVQLVHQFKFTDTHTPGPSSPARPPLSDPAAAPTALAAGTSAGKRQVVCRPP